MSLRALIAGVGVAFVLAAPAAAREAAPPLVIRGDVQIAGFKTHESLGSAITVFGVPSSRQELAGYQRFCVVRWDEIGLEMRFFARGCASGATFVGARAVGARWQTIRGLRVGDPAGRVRALYPDARSQRLANGVTKWVVLKRGTTPAGLTVTTNAGRVVALVVSTAFYTLRWG